MTEDNGLHIFSGEPINDRKSKFQAFCAVCRSVQDVSRFREALLSDPKIDRATHNILAYITPEEAGYDDDGESHAGIQVLEMMEQSGAHDCAVIISRWFGGIMLHGDRFRDITGVAIKVLKDSGLIPEPPKPEEKKAKKSDEKKQKGGKSKRR